MLSFHRCIAPTVDLGDDTYLNNLALRAPQRELLRVARRLVRETLRTAFRRDTARFAGEEIPITPNFVTQGSWEYKTINRATHVPPQQTDMDDGCYLPMTFVRGATPKRAATWFFGVADRALKALVEQRRWKDYDDSKDMCCRIVLDAENHLDVPLYAIEDRKFIAMKALATERAAAFAEAVTATADVEDELAFDWSQVTSEEVLLARRSGIWQPSNPMDVSRWANAAAEQKGEQLRKTWRGMKGWRDQMFPNGGGPSSILLMVMLEADFEEIAKRDDLALAVAARTVRERIVGSVLAPWDKREDLNRLSPAERSEIARMARELEAEIEYCVQGTLANAGQYAKRLRSRFGRHFTEDTTRIVEVSPREVIRAYPVAPAVAPQFLGDNRSA